MRQREQEVRGGLAKCATDRAGTHARGHAHAHAPVHAHARARACMRMRACALACACARVCACVCVCMRMCTHAREREGEARLSERLPFGWFCATALTIASAFLRDCRLAIGIIVIIIIRIVVAQDHN